MTRTLLAVMLIAALEPASAHAAEPILGRWKTPHGETTDISACGGDYCVTVKTGTYAGRRIGTMTGAGKDYSGEITDPENGKTYSGLAFVSGNVLTMKGCVLKVLCRSQTWHRH